MQDERKYDPPKFIQIAVSPETDGHALTLFALDKDGDIYKMSNPSARDAEFKFVGGHPDVEDYDESFHDAALPDKSPEAA